MLMLLVMTHLCCRYVNVVERRLTVTVLHLNTILSRKIFLKKYFTQENILFKSIKYLLFLVGWRSRSVGCQGTIHWYFLWLRAEGEFTVIIFPPLITTLQCLHLYSRDLSSDGPVTPIKCCSSSRGGETEWQQVLSWLGTDWATEKM